MHLQEDDLVLHYYGELDAAGAARAAAHLGECAQCHAAYAGLQRVLAAVDAAPAPVLPEGFERIVWARLEPALPVRRGWLAGVVLSSARLAWVAAIVVLVAGAFFAGRLSERAAAPASTLASGEDLRERILLSDVGEHLDRSQMMLVELVSAGGGDVVDISAERERAEELVAANRLYRQSANASGDAALSELLDELERLLVELAASPDEIPAEDMDRVRSRLDAKGLLFKVRVVSSAVKERQKQQIEQQLRIRTGQSS